MTDAEKIMRRITNNTDMIDEFPTQDTGPVSHMKSDQLRKAYSVIPRNVKDKLRQVYNRDFQVFGYDLWSLRKTKPTAKD